MTLRRSQVAGRDAISRLLGGLQMAARRRLSARQQLMRFLRKHFGVIKSLALAPGC